jgi:putative transposase
MMQLTITAKVKIKPIPEQIDLLLNTLKAYRNGCNFISQIIFRNKRACSG